MRRKRNDELAVAMRGVRTEADAIVEVIRALNRVEYDRRKRVALYALRVVGIDATELPGSVERAFRIPPHTHSA
jgi:hypothetical protein